MDFSSRYILYILEAAILEQGEVIIYLCYANKGLTFSLLGPRGTFPLCV
jgi:hypothetical protein